MTAQGSINTLGGEHFQEYFFADCKCEEIAGEVRKILELV